MEPRVAHLEEDMRDVKATLARLEPVIVRMDAALTATLPHLATKAELADLRGEVTGNMADQRGEVTGKIADLRSEVTGKIVDLRSEMTSEFSALRGDLAEKPGKAYLWGVLAVLIAAYAAGLAGLAVLR
jgi:hypothetical protein